ncbi:MAG TPA: universal stress protein [Candidatus Nitrosotalea sp.]|nr:universal stress protein [Candidatus Nitrosotalea sp.]
MRRRRAPVPRPMRRILHATDFSAASRAAFRMAVSLARRERAALLLLHVLTPPSPFAAPGGTVPSSYLALLQAARGDAQRRLAEVLRRARTAGALARERLVEGDPADEILKLGRRWRPDLIVIGTHGRGGVSRFFMGSVAEDVVRRASRPVLTVRGR